MRRFLVALVALGVALMVGIRSEAVDSSRAAASSVTPITWVDEPVSFPVGGLTVYATFRHPLHDPFSTPGVLLIAGSGPTNRNGNTTEAPGPVNTIENLADWLSQDGVASLRYDKLGSGQTGLGPFASQPSAIGVAPYQQETAAAFRFLARQKGIDDQRLGVFAHSEGALYALLLASGHDGHVPPIHALGLFEPLSIRYLDLLEVQVQAQLTSEVAAGSLTSQAAAAQEAALAGAVQQFRATDQLPPNLPYGISNYFAGPSLKYLDQADRFVPETLAASIPKGTPVLITCSNVDAQVTCPEVDQVHQGLVRSHSLIDFVHLSGVNHGLRVDPTGTNYSTSLRFSPVLRTAIKQFVRSSL